MTPRHQKEQPGDGMEIKISKRVIENIGLPDGMIQDEIDAIVSTQDIPKEKIPYSS